MSAPTTGTPSGPHSHLGERPLSRIGLGAWAFGRTGWGDQQDRDSRAAILRAVELGVNWIDTAAVYGDGHSERLIGRTLADLPERDRPLVFTKAGVRVDPASGKTHRDLSPSSLRAECDASLRRLGVEAIDLYQLHWPVEDATVVEAAWATLGELRAEGKIRHAGVSNFGVQLLERCAPLGAIESVQLPLSLLSRDGASELLAWLAAREVPGLVYSPLESGLLSGGFSLQRLDALGASDWRGSREQFRRPQVERALAFVDRLREIADEHSTSPAVLAIAWTLAWPGVAGAIVGARGAAQVDGLIDAAGIALDPATLDQIALALVQTRAGSGPERPRRSTVTRDCDTHESVARGTPPAARHHRR